MTFIAKSTLKNAYDEVLFMEGYKYYASDEDEKRYYIFNELHTETPVRKIKVHEDFTVVE